ncbi:UPF0481 protein At3g47200-like [Nymphaea colorata]|nr:UPF0481 protein At3g47200-like [Nymphaea colorata]
MRLALGQVLYKQLRNAATTSEEKKEDKDSWVVVIQQNFELYNPSAYHTKLAKRSIYKWPNDLVVASDFIWYHTPQLASFGPYHHGKKHLQPMEHHKERALYRILKRSKASLSNFVNSLRQVEQELSDSYDDLDHQLSSYPFLKMMLLDGCFILELLLSDGQPNENSSDTYEPIFRTDGKLTNTVAFQDMLLLENQIPLLVLRKLLEVVERREIKDDAYLDCLICNFYEFKSMPIDRPGLHVLDVYRKCLIMDSTTEEQTTPSVGFIKSVFLQCEPWLYAISQGIKRILLAIPILVFRLLSKQISKPGNMRSAMRFHEAGIEFKKGNNSGLKISFDEKHGVLTLPYISIEDHTAAIYMNLMAFERMHPKIQNHEVTTYISFMDDLIDTAEDVSLLCSRGIVRNLLGSDEDAAKVFNKLGDGMTFTPDEELYEDLQSYVASDWNAARAYLKRNYFQNPWSILSLLAAIALLLLTFIQTLFSVLAVTKGK